MKNLKKILSMIITVCMVSGLISMVPVSAGAASNKYVLVKYDNEATVAASASSYLSSGGLEETYNGVTSLKFTSKGNTDYIKFPASTEKDWSKYGWLHIRLYAQRAGMEFNVIPTTFDTGSVENNPYFLKKYTTVAPGWQDVAIPIETGSEGFGAYSKPLGAGGAVTAPSWNNIGGLCIIAGAWNATSMNVGEVMYFDEVWLGDYEITGNTDGVNGTVLVDTNSISAIENSFSGKAVVSDAESREGGNSAYALITVPSQKETNWELKTFNTPINLTESANKYLNMWIYSPRAYNGGLQVMCYDTNGGFGMYVLGEINWKGWKLVTIDLGANPKAKSGSKGFDNTSVKSIGLNAGGYSSNKYVGYWPVEAKIGLEKAWLSSSMPQSSVMAVPETAQETNLPVGTFLTSEFNSTSSIASVQGSAFNTQWSGVTGYNPMVNDFNARMSWWQGNPQRNTVYYDEEYAVLSSDYKYWNTWVYNPDVKLNGENTPDLLFRATVTDDGTNLAIKINKIKLDWSGWKLITVDIEELLGEDYGKGIQRLGIWVNNSNSDIKTTDTGNFIDVERSWLSLQAPVTTFARANSGSSIAADSVDVPTDIGSYSLTMTSEPDARLLNKVSVFSGTTPLISNVDYTISAEGKEINITFNKNLECNTKYTVRLDKSFADVFGNQLGKSKVYSFTTRAYEIGEVVFGEDGKSVSVSIHVNDIEYEYPFMLILSNMKGDKPIKAKIDRARLSGKNIDHTLKASFDSVEEGTQLHAMIWDYDLEPYIYKVSK